MLLRRLISTGADRMKSVLPKLAALSVVLPPLAWGNSCAVEGSNGKIVNGCWQTVVFSFRGIASKTGQLDCRRGQIGMAGVPPGWTVIDLGDFDRVYTMNCPDGSVPFNVAWNGLRLTADCH